MEAWKSMAVAAGRGVASALTWDQWCAYQARRVAAERPARADLCFSERELARLSFLRWAHQTGRLDSAGESDL